MEKITITAGKYKGRKLKTPGGATHPMGSRERLALFNMLTGKIAGAFILDAFAGSGALGIEALSRDAKKVVFVEKNPKAVATISENLRSLQIQDGFETIKSRISEVNLGEFDVVLADPPYDDFDLKEVETLDVFVKKGGILALSHPGDAPIFDGFSLTKTHKYAAAHLSIYSKN